MVIACDSDSMRRLVVLQETTSLFRDVRWLRQQVIRVWETRLQRACCIGVGSNLHFAEVTACFEEVARDSSIGGVALTEQTAQAYDILMCVWMAAVLTSMLFVAGATCQTEMNCSIDTYVTTDVVRMRA